MLDEIAVPDAVLARMREELPHDIELMVARENLLLRDLPGFLVLLLDDLGVVLDDVGEPDLGENFLPKVIGLQAIRVRWIPRPVVPSLVERQEPFALKVGAKPDFGIVDGEMRHAAAKLEDAARADRDPLVLLDGVGDGLLRETVLELEGRDRKPVDEEPQIERVLVVAQAVTELASDAEAVLRKALRGLVVSLRRRSIEEVDVMLPVLDALAQHVDDAALGDLTLETSEEFLARRGCRSQGRALRRVWAASAAMNSRSCTRSTA